MMKTVNYHPYEKKFKADSALGAEYNKLESEFTALEQKLKTKSQRKPVKESGSSYGLVSHLVVAAH